MARFFMVAGVVVVVIAVLITLFLMYHGGFIYILSGIGYAVFGLSLMALSDVMKRLERLETFCGVTPNEPPENALPQKVCCVCVKTYDFDYPKCPYCGHADE